MKRLIVVGGGGHGKVVAESAEKLCKYTEIVFVDDRYPSINSNRHWPVVNSINGILEELVEGDEVIIAIGHNRTRSEIQKRFQKHGAAMASVVDPSAVVSQYVRIGVGCFIAPNTTINVDCQIGEGVIVNTNASIDHDNLIESFVHVAPGSHLAGSINVREGAFIGIGSAVLPGLTIGSWATVGGGSVVINNIESEDVAFGNPAKKREVKL